MAQPTHVTISYRRQVQPAQYEAEEVRLEGSFSVEEGEDFEAVAYDMVARARIQAHRVLGRPEPAIGPFIPSLEESEATIHGEHVDNAAEAATRTKRKRRTKAEMEASAKIAREATDALIAERDKAEAAADALAELGGAAPAPVSFDFDITAEVAKTKEITGEDLQQKSAEAARKLGGSEAIKKIMLEFKVGRLGDIPQEKRQAYIDALVAAVAAHQK